MPDYDPTALSVVDQKNEIGLTNSQHQALIEQYVQLQVDSMEMEDLVSFVTQTLTQDLREIESREELCDEIKYTFDEETLDEVVDNVTNETFIDVNNNGGKF